jgi:hypothetical protein
MFILPYFSATSGQHPKRTDSEPNPDNSERHDVNTKRVDSSVARDKADSSRRSAELESLILELSALPAEISGDALIRIAASENVLSREWKKEILEKVIDLAPSAQYPVRRRNNSTINRSVDTSGNYVSNAFDRRVDTLSLRTRGIKAMLAIDKERARELLLGISPKLPLPSLTCDDELVYDVSEYYELVAQIAQQTFTDEEVREGVRVRFVQTYFDAVSSPAQLTAIIKLILSLKPSRAELALLVPDLTRILDTIPLDDRSFTYAVTRDNLTRQVYQLKQSLQKRKIYLVKDLTDAYRNYLSTNMSGARCAENAVTDKSNLPWYIKEANSELFQEHPLTFVEVEQKDISGRANVYSYWKTPNAQRLLELFQDLRFPTATDEDKSEEDDPSGAKAADIGDTTQSEAENESVASQTKFRNFLTELEAFDGRNEKSEMDFLSQKQVLYQGLYAVTREAMRREVFKSWAKSLDQYKADKSNRILWCLYVSYLCDAARNAPTETRDEFLDLMIYSNNAGLSVSGKLVKLHI